MEHFDDYLFKPNDRRYQSDLKFAVLHVAHAAELLLKDVLLSKYAEIAASARSQADGSVRVCRTINMFKKHSDFQGAHAQCTLQGLKMLALLRNEIEHDEFDESRNKVKRRIGAGLAGIRWMLRSFFSETLESYIPEFLPGDSWEDRLLDRETFDRVRADIEAEFQETNPDSVAYTCVSCATRALASLADPCPVCGHTAETVQCMGCGAQYCPSEPLPVEEISDKCAYCPHRSALHGPLLRGSSLMDIARASEIELGNLQAFMESGTTLDESDADKLDAYVSASVGE